MIMFTDVEKFMIPHSVVFRTLKKIEILIKIFGNYFFSFQSVF